MGYVLHLGDMKSAALVLSRAVRAIQGRPAAKKGPAAPLAGNAVVANERTGAAAVRLVGAHSADNYQPIPFLSTTLFASQEPTFAVGSVVLLTRKHFEIFGAIVERIAVLVVNHFVSAKRTAKVFLHDYSMLIAAFVLSPYLRRQDPVAMRNGCARLEVLAAFANQVSLVHVFDYNTVVQCGQID